MVKNAHFDSTMSSAFFVQMQLLGNILHTRLSENYVNDYGNITIQQLQLSSKPSRQSVEINVTLIF